jgi:hypothetical protein
LTRPRPDSGQKNQTHIQYIYLEVKSGRVKNWQLNGLITSLTVTGDRAGSGSDKVKTAPLLEFHSAWSPPYETERSRSRGGVTAQWHVRQQAYSVDRSSDTCRSVKEGRRRRLGKGICSYSLAIPLLIINISYEP